MTAEPVNPQEYQRVLWHSRRGMLELDLVLGPFVRLRYRDLPAEQQSLYRDLLNCQDQELFDWFLGKSQPQSPDLRGMVELILTFQKQRDLNAPVDC